MMATVPHVTSGSGIRKFQADGFLLDRVYNGTLVCYRVLAERAIIAICTFLSHRVG